MSFALKELSDLLAPPTVEVGLVVGVEGPVLRVATGRGAIRARASEPMAVGDRVRIQNGFATKAPVARWVFPV